jgi:hypothetical protein
MKADMTEYSIRMHKNVGEEVDHIVLIDGRDDFDLKLNLEPYSMTSHCRWSLSSLLLLLFGIDAFLRS